jgi:hypothetical protein
LEATVQNTRQILHIPIEIHAVRIECSSEMLDFGTVNSDNTVNKMITFEASDHRQLALSANVVPELNDSLNIRISDNTLEAVLKDIHQAKNRIVKHEGPGITVQDSGTGCKKELFVKFQRTFPVFYVERRVIDMGEIVGGNAVKGSFKLSNKGDGILSVKIFTNSPDFSIEKPHEFDLYPEKDTHIHFTLNLKDIQSERQFKGEIIINTNDFSAGSFQKIVIKANILSPEGKICPNPECPYLSYLLVIPMDKPYCEICRASMQHAVTVSKKDLVICSFCGRKYKSKIKYCPKDGKAVTRLV